MTQNKKRLEALLAYKDAHAPWFTLDWQEPHVVIKRNLKLLARLDGTAKITPDYLEQLTEHELKTTISAYTTGKATNPTPVAPVTATQFFHSRMATSAYFSEIIPYPVQQRTVTSKDSALSASIPTSPATAKKNTEPVHGFHLNEDEAFSSTRFFSDDQQSFAQIIAKNGEFKATHQNLNNEQKADLAFEMSYQFLLNLPSDKKTVHLDGPPEMVHKMHAALLYLQKEAGSRFADVTFHLPEGMSVAPEEVNDAYIKKNIGEMSKPPPQVIQWRDFLNRELNAPKNDADTQLESSLKEERAPIINMERVFNVDDLSQQDKRHLNEYQRYLKEVWLEGAKELKKHPGDTQYLIDTHEEFMQRTESALRIFKQSPSLQKEFAAFKMLYTETVESHQETLEALHLNHLNYEAQMSELLVKYQKASRASMNECLYQVSQYLEAEMRLHPELSEAHANNLRHHLQSMHEIKSLIGDQEELSNEMLRSFGAQIVHALNCLESTKDYSTSPLFQQMKDFSQAMSAKKEYVTKTGSEQLKHAGNHLKERLNQFKKEFMEPKASECAELLVLSAKQKEQLATLREQVSNSIESIETREGKSYLKQLAKKMQELCNTEKISTEHLEALHQSIDKATLHLKENQGLVLALLEMKTSTTISPIAMPLASESDTAPGCTMP